MALAGKGDLLHLPIQYYYYYHLGNKTFKAPCIALCPSNCEICSTIYLDDGVSQAKMFVDLTDLFWRIKYLLLSETGVYFKIILLVQASTGEYVNQ
jgi:hypothetical protein